MKKDRKHDVIVVVTTVLACAAVAGLVVYHILAIKNAELKGFENGARSVKSILQSN